MSLLEEIENDEKLTSKYRDKILIERINILNEYAQETSNKGIMFYVYSKNSKSNDVYNIYQCQEGKSSNIIQVDRNQLPRDTNIGSILRNKEGDYILDIQDAEEIRQRIDNMIFKLLGEQEKTLNYSKIEGHIYEVGVKEDKNVWLFDITNGKIDGIEAQEVIDFQKDLIDIIKEGDKIKYQNGEYILLK